MKEISKQSAIEKIVEDDIDTITFGSVEGLSYLTEILRFGCDGWENQTVVDLQTELDNRFPSEFVINNEL